MLQGARRACARDRARRGAWQGAGGERGRTARATRGGGGGCSRAHEVQRWSKYNVAVVAAIWA